MIFKGGFEMKTSRTLISSAMLTAMCDTNSIDNLKLLEKFVAMCVAETTDVGSLIDKDKVLKRMDESYSFHDMPMPVLEKILQRMSRGSERSITTSTSNNYKLIKNARAEIMSVCGGNPDMLDDTSVLAVRDRVRAKYTEKEAAETAAAKADAEQAKQDRDTASQKLISSQSEIKRSIGTLRKTARKTADDRAKKIARRIKSLIIAALVIIMIATAIATVIVGISSSSGILTFIVALISGLSAATLWLPLMKVGNLLENRLFNKIEGTLYIKELARVTPQIQVLEDLLKDSSSAT